MLFLMSLYYIKRDGDFVLSIMSLKKLKKGKYKVYINSKFTNGNLVIGEKLIKGKSKKRCYFLHIYATHLWPIMSYLDQ